MFKRLRGLLALLVIGAAMGAAVFFYLATRQSPTLGTPLEQALSILPRLEDVRSSVLFATPLRGGGADADVVLTQDGIIAETNRHRTEAGRDPLSINVLLTAAAEAKLSDMFANQYFDHISPAGIEPSFWVEQAGYTFVTTGENLAEGNFADDAELVQAWMDSPGHRENILHENFEEIGIATRQGTFQGKTTWLAVQVFGRPTSSCPQINQNLKVAIDASQKQLDIVQQQLDALSTQLEQEKPRGPRPTQAAVDAYNELVARYNATAAEFNRLVEDTKVKVTQFNDQVNAFNACASELTY